MLGRHEASETDQHVRAQEVPMASRPKGLRLAVLVRDRRAVLKTVVAAMSPWVQSHTLRSRPAKALDRRGAPRDGGAPSSCPRPPVLRALTTTWEVYCHPFHVRFADLALEPVAPPELPEEIS